MILIDNERLKPQLIKAILADNILLERIKVCSGQDGVGFINASTPKEWQDYLEQCTIDQLIKMILESADKQTESSDWDYKQDLIHLVFSCDMHLEDMKQYLKHILGKSFSDDELRAYLNSLDIVILSILMRYTNKGYIRSR